MPDPDRRAFFTHTAMAAAAGVAAAAGLHAVPAKGATAATTPTADQRKFMEEATRLATELVEKGWGGPFGAVIVKDGEIIGRGQNRVLLTGCPVFHAEVTAIIDASAKLNPKALLGSDYGAGTILEMIPREPNSPDLVPMRARMLKGCDIYINGAPCPMCMSAIYWSRIDHVYLRRQPQGHQRDRLRRRLPIRGFRQAVEPAAHPDRGKLRARHDDEILQGLDG